LTFGNIHLQEDHWADPLSLPAACRMVIPSSLYLSSLPLAFADPDMAAILLIYYNIFENFIDIRHLVTYYG
jgi:hypothetical protein